MSDLTSDKRWTWLATMPQGAAKTVVALLCMLLTGVVLWGAVILEKKVDESWLWPWLTFVAAVLGVSHLDFRIKRQTYTPAPPNEPDIEDAKAGVPVTPPVQPVPVDEVEGEPATVTRGFSGRPLQQQLIDAEARQSWERVERETKADRPLTASESQANMDRSLARHGFAPEPPRRPQFADIPAQPITRQVPKDE